MRLKIKHSTRYQFDKPVSYGVQQLRTTPKTTQDQWILNWTTTIQGGRKEAGFEDFHNNTTELVSFDRETQELIVTSEGEVELNDSSGVVGKHRGPAPLWLYQRDTPRTKAGAQARAIVRGLQGESVLDRLHEMMAAISAQVEYKVGSSESDWTAEDALNAGEGVCQDHTHVFLSCAREMGVPARYVSGYLMLNETVAQDAMHAWAEAHVDGLGWVGFDVSNAMSPDDRYVRVATGLDYGEAAPVSGTRIGGAAEALEVHIEVAQQ